MSIIPPEDLNAAVDPVAVQPCVLIVEDDAMVASYVSEVLVEAGFQVAGVASTASEAFTLAERQACVLALVDIRLPGPKDGIEIAGELRRRFGIGAIFLSGTSDPEHIARAKRVSPYGFLQKPFLPSQMYKALDKALKQRQAERGETLPPA
jgi:two-component system, response regulator PdtaR